MLTPKKPPAELPADARLVRTRLGHYYLCVPMPLETRSENQAPSKQKHATISVDPGVRTFQSGSQWRAQHLAAAPPRFIAAEKKKKKNKRDFGLVGALPLQQKKESAMDVLFRTFSFAVGCQVVTGRLAHGAVKNRTVRFRVRFRFWGEKSDNRDPCVRFKTARAVLNRTCGKKPHTLAGVQAGSTTPSLDPPSRRLTRTLLRRMIEEKRDDRSAKKGGLRAARRS